MIRWTRLAATGIAAIGGAAMLLGPPAHAASISARSAGSATGITAPATSGDCTYVLRTSGYALTAQRTAACNYADSWDPTHQLVCKVVLQSTGVSSYVATLACNVADD